MLPFNGTTMPIFDPNNNTLTAAILAPQGPLYPTGAAALVPAPPTYAHIPNRIFVGGYPAPTKEADLRKHFEKFFPVVDVKMIRDINGESRGFGFVTFEDEETAEAVRKVPPSKLVFRNRRLNLGPAIRRVNSPIPGATYSVSQNFVFPASPLAQPNQYFLFPTPPTQNSQSQPTTPICHSPHVHQQFFTNVEQTPTKISYNNNCNNIRNNNNNKNIERGNLAPSAPNTPYNHNKSMNRFNFNHNMESPSIDRTRNANNNRMIKNNCVNLANCNEKPRVNSSFGINFSRKKTPNGFSNSNAATQRNRESEDAVKNVMDKLMVKRVNPGEKKQLDDLSTLFNNKLKILNNHEKKDHCNAK